MTIFLSLVSGLVGAMVGAGIQIFYNNKIEKQRLLHDYKKICFAEWLHLNEELLILLREPQKENNTVFRQAIKQKTELLSFIAAVSKKHEKAVSKLKKHIVDIDERISLSDFAEEAVNIGKVQGNKTKLIREVSTLITEVLDKLAKL